jgi:hypothetical protein
VDISFLSTGTNSLATPASLVIPEGSTNAVFPIAVGGQTLTGPATLKLYATDGSVSRSFGLTVTPVVRIASISGGSVEGGFSTWASVALNIPAQWSAAGGASVSLASGNASVLALPPSVLVPAGYTMVNVPVNTVPVAALTTVPVSATFNGETVSGSFTVGPAPVVSLSGVASADVVGGQPVTVTVTLNNFPRAAAGAVVTLGSGDTGTLQVPASVTVPYGSYSASVVGTTVVVNGRKGVSIRAAYNGATFSTTVFVSPIPPVTVTQADYMLDTKMLKVQASTPYTNSTLTYGGDPAAGPFGTMQLELGVYKGSIVLQSPPAVVTVWTSVGGQASMPVTVRTGVGGGTATGGGGGGGGGTTTTTTASGSYKLTLKTTGKGTVTTSPAGTSFAAGTVVTLTATPDVGSPWIGWSGDATGTARTVSITMGRAMTVQANFK